MKKIIELGLLMGLFILSSSTYASYYCSTGKGNGYISLGDSIEAVQQTCGQPTNIEQQEVRSQQTSSVEYWLYENNEAQSSSSDSVMPVVGKFQNSQQPTLGNLQVNNKSVGPSAVFKIENRQIIGISRNGIDTNIYAGCRSGSAVQVGGSVEQLIGACGQPSYVNVQNTATSTSITPTMRAIWTYDLGTYSSPLILQFENNKLTAINPSKG